MRACTSTFSDDARAADAGAAPSHAALAQAAEWYASLRDGRAGADERAAWRTWLEATAEHGIAWRYVEDISRAFEPVRALPDARGAAEQLSAANSRLHSRRRVLASVGLVAGGASLGWLGWREAWLPDDLMAWGAQHRTGVGKQRQLNLADGSRLWLNTASAVDIRFNATERCIVLRAGEIFIETARDTSGRSLVVETPQGRLRALGTRFNVRRQAGATQLAVYEGAVEIRTANANASAVVEAGRQARFTDDEIDAAVAADFAREAWITGTLVADSMTLGDLIRELRRYRQGHLGVADEVAGLKVYGNFPVRDTDRVLRMLASALPLRIAEPLPWWTSIEPLR